MLFAACHWRDIAHHMHMTFKYHDKHEYGDHHYLHHLHDHDEDDALDHHNHRYHTQIFYSFG